MIVPEGKPARETSRTWIVVLAIVAGSIMVLGFIGFIVGDIMGDYNKVLKLSAKSMNMSVPKMISDGVRLDSVAAKPGLELWYYYTLTEIERDEESIDEFCESYESGIIENLGTEKSVEEFGKNGVSLVFELADKNGTLMCTTYVSPDKYYQGNTTK